MKKDADMKIAKTILKHRISEEFKLSRINQSNNIVGTLLFAIILLICVAFILFITVYLIENPVSLAIICGTIILIIIWRTR